MDKNIIYPKKDHKGFTLIELLVVISIIALLAAIVLAAMGGSRKKGSDVRVQSDVHQLKIQLEVNRTSSSYYSIDLNGAGMNNWQTSAGSSTIVNTLIADIVANGASLTIRTAGNPTSAYLMYGSLPSQNNSKFYCVSSINSPDPMAPNNTTVPAATGSPCP
jgi:prepilin-type N-terminal cleavage/methylation domain-containing protein